MNYAKRTQVILGVGIPAVFLLLALTAVLIANTHDVRPAPDPISQDRLVTSYLQLVPDREVTPASITRLADIACERLSHGVARNDLIDSTASVYHSRATAEQVLNLLTSYGCPSYSR